MTNRNNNRNQPHTGSKADTEFGAELTQSKKARKRAARDRKNNS